MAEKKYLGKLPKYCTAKRVTQTSLWHWKRLWRIIWW